MSASEYVRTARAAALDMSEKHTGKRGCKHCKMARLSLEALGLLDQEDDTKIADPPKWATTTPATTRGNTDSFRRAIPREAPVDKATFTTPAGLRNSPKSSAS